jgi:predicted PhzF superfamily epimerase YddE/YHI9
MGIPEDHVTGSAHSVLGPYWRDKLAVDEGSQPDLVMKARQCSPRGGDLTVWVDAPKGKVVISGDATVVIRGIIQI